MEIYHNANTTTGLSYLFFGDWSYSLDDPLPQHISCCAGTRASVEAPCATCPTKISSGARSIEWEVKYDTGNTYSDADIILTPDLVEQLGLVQGEQLKAFAPWPSGTMFHYGTVKVTSPVDPADTVHMVAGVICSADGRMVERDTPVVSAWRNGQVKLQGAPTRNS